jgi:hypothetical protein
MVECLGDGAQLVRNDVESGDGGRVGSRVLPGIVDSCEARFGVRVVTCTLCTTCFLEDIWYDEIKQSIQQLRTG